jgi:PAS domain S-box-containing protein
MILLDLTYNLTLLIALSVVSGFIDTRWPRGTFRGAILQGVLFGGGAVIGMLRPVMIVPGVVFDGRSVMISLGALFFGPWATAVACLIAIPFRISQGGTGTCMGTLVIVSSALIGVAFHLRQRHKHGEISPAILLGFGIVVHVAMLAMVTCLPAEIILPVLKRIAWPVMLAYPLATVLIGKILTDQASRSEMMETLRLSEAQFRAMVETMPLAIALSQGIEQTIQYVNPKLMQLFGYSLEDMSTMEHWWPLAYPDADYRQQISREWTTRVQHALANQSSIEPMEVVVTCKDGSRKDILWGYITLGDKSYAYGLDLTSRKQAEQTLLKSLREKESLLKEIHHRVNNNLQIISSLLRLQAVRLDNPIAQAALHDMQNRVRSMALIHEHLYRSETFSEVDLSTYLKQLCQQLFRSLAPAPATIRLHLELDPVCSAIEQAIPCGLLVNELVSNALEHAFPDGRAGEVRVELRALDGAAGWRLRVMDTGVGLPPDLPMGNLSTLGLQLVVDLSRQLGGQLDIGAGPGAAFEVTCRPAALGKAY